MNNILADIKLAMELENQGYDFYNRTARLTRNPLAQATLSGLAERELEHLNMIKKYYANYTNNQKLPDDWLMGIKIYEEEDLIKPILDKLRTALDKEFETADSINEAYLVAENMEKDSFNLYNKIAKETQDQTAKNFFSLLAQEEQRHFDLLEETLQYLNRPGDWFKEKERWIVEG